MTAKMLSNEIWHNLLCATQLKHYSDRLGRRMRRFDLTIRITTLASAVAGGGYIATGIAVKNRMELFTLIVAITVFVLGFVLRFQEKATVLHYVGLECGRIRDAYHDLWSRFQDAVSEESQLREENRKLADRATEVAGWAGFVDLFEDTGLNKKCRKAAKDEVSERYLRSNGNNT